MAGFAASVGKGNQEKLGLIWISYDVGLTQKDLANIIGFKSRVSEIMNGKRKLSLDMIRKINTRLNISTDVLIKEY
ncbi:MAG TPA: helix-turn-helix domain-containing protein [Puia sp.]|jgi:antitoxin component HigA of HigAB toxin-antitoxin module